MGRHDRGELHRRYRVPRAVLRGWTIPARVPVLFAAGAAAIVAVHYWAYASGWSLKLRDPNFVLPTMVASFAMQLGVFALAPQLAFPLLANLFTVFAFGAIWLSVRASVVAWAVGAGLTGIVMFAVAERAGMPTGTLFERTLVWLFFTLILGRFVLLSANATAMRTRLYDSRRKLAQSLAQGEWGAIAPGMALTVSVGVAGYSSGDTVAQLLHRADVALYEAKRTGRDRIVVA